MGDYQERFSIVEQVFQNHDREFLLDLGETPFLPTSHDQVFKAMKYLISEDIINKDKLFIDLGSGAGDVTTVVSYVFGMPTIGIELDKKLISFARKIDNELEDRLGSAPLQYIQSDFTLEKHYEDVDIGLLFNFLSGDISKVMSFVPKGTYFLSYLNGGEEEPLDIDKKKALRTIINLPSYGAVGQDLKNELVSRISEKYSSWSYILTIPNTEMHLYQKDYLENYNEESDLNIM